MPNNKPQPQPTSNNPLDHLKTSAEVTQQLAEWREQLSSFESQLEQISKAEFAIGPSYTQGEAAAVKRMAELEQQSATTALHIKLVQGNIELAEIHRKLLIQLEATQQEVARKRDYEKLLLAALEEARHADTAIQTYAAAMHARAVLLEEAQQLAIHVHELGVLRQLRGPQGPSWQLGHYGVTRLLDPHAFGYTVGFQPLEIYSTAMLPNYNLQGSTTDDPHQENPSASAPTVSSLHPQAEVGRRPQRRPN
jgi:hypothetical protein